MQLNQCLGDRQAEAGAVMLSGQMIRDLLEGLEHLLHLFRGNADPRISDRNHQVSVLVQYRADLYAAIGLRKLHAIGY